MRKIVAAEILLRRIVKFVIACNPGHRWEIKPKEIKRSFANQRRGRNFRWPGPVKYEQLTEGFPTPTSLKESKTFLGLAYDH